MSDVSGIPNLGIPGMGIGGPNTFLNNNASGYSPDAIAAMNNNNAAALANQNYIRAYGQQTIDQQNADWARTNPATNYGHVGGYPSFGEAGNYGGQNDPFSGGYAPGNQGYSGKPVKSVFETGAAPFNDYGNPAFGAQPTGFNAQAYLQNNQDVFKAGADPWQHYNMHGKNEGREEPLFQGYSTTGPGASAQQPAFDWTTYYNSAAAPAEGGKRGGFEAEYLLANPDVAAAAKAAGGDVNAYADDHWRNYGQSEGRTVFDPAKYLQNNQDVAAAGANPFEHYLNYGQKEGRALTTGGDFDAAGYYAANPDVFAAGADAADHYATYGQIEGRNGGWEFSSRNRNPFQDGSQAFNGYGLDNGGTGDGSVSPTGNYDQFAPGTGLQDRYNPLVQQRLGAKNALAGNETVKFNTAAKLYEELSNDPEGRVGLYEAMLNRMNATGQNPLNKKYYPQGPEYDAKRAVIADKLRSNPDLLNQIYGEMDRVYGGSNVSNYATNWASDEPGNPVATNALKYATGTWLSPVEGEQFYRKDLMTPDPRTGEPHSGAGIVRQNLKWLENARQPLWPKP